MSREDWEATMSRTPAPKKGCFTSSYPSTEWREVPCTTPPPNPNPPALGFGSETVGGSEMSDWTAKSATGTISAAVGSFDSVTGVTDERGTKFGETCSDRTDNVPDTFTLQLNTNLFSTSACDKAKDPKACNGWQQFVYSTDGFAYIQYWLLNYDTTCPASPVRWLPSGSHCFGNGATASGIPAQKIANLAQLRLTGRAASGGDTVMMSTGDGKIYMMAEKESVLRLDQGWNVAEFNIFGNHCSSEATFNPGSTLVVRTSLNEGSKMAPTCTRQSFAGETNNLNLVAPPTMVMAGTLPAIVFTESNAPGKPPDCSASNGDTHLITVDGLFYDFQASGDFLLVQADRDEFRAWGDPPLRNFVVQTRQVSGAPKWPNASVNKAVATRMGGTRVAVCLAPTRLLINGNSAQLDDGESFALPGDVSVTRIKNAYDIRRPGGDIVWAEVNDGWIDVFVGVAPDSKVRGLLGNFNGDTDDDIAKRDGTVLAQPVSFADLYRSYGESWRVSSSESLLSVCGDGNLERRNPGSSFYASDLKPDQYKRARDICTAAGVEDPSLLDACTLDVTVLDNEAAATVFTLAPTPVAVMQPVSLIP
jgi:hypothetical protein